MERGRSRGLGAQATSDAWVRYPRESADLVVADELGGEMPERLHVYAAAGPDELVDASGAPSCLAGEISETDWRWRAIPNEGRHLYFVTVDARDGQSHVALVSPISAEDWVDGRGTVDNVATPLSELAIDAAD